jgi:heat-inducible transcriptional repressor
MSQPAFPGHLTPEDPDLSDRQRRVFAALVELHAATARPVGSETLARDGDIPLSAASIRGELADLEGLGLLERAHAAAGRVPSRAGYGYFVRTLLAPAALDREWIEEIDRTLVRSARDVEVLLHEASRLLSTYTHQLGLAHADALEEERLSRIDLEALDERRAVMVLDLGPGSVRTLVLELETPLERGALAEVCSVLRERLVGRSLAEVRDRLAHDPELVRGSALRLVVRAAAASWSPPASTPLFSAGVVHMARQPEFTGHGRLGSVLQVVETGQPINRLMATGVEGQVAVRVDVDESRALSGLSLVSYPLPGTVRGAVGVLGPRRMDYARALAVVDAVGSRVADILQS